MIKFMDNSDKRKLFFFGLALELNILPYYFRARGRFATRHLHLLPIAAQRVKIRCIYKKYFQNLSGIRTFDLPVAFEQKME